jgi:hypothetical protein
MMHCQIFSKWRTDLTENNGYKMIYKIRAHPFDPCPVIKLFCASTILGKL